MWKGRPCVREMSPWISPPELGRPKWSPTAHHSTNRQVPAGLYPFFPPGRLAEQGNGEAKQYFMHHHLPDLHHQILRGYLQPGLLKSGLPEDFHLPHYINLRLSYAGGVLLQRLRMHPQRLTVLPGSHQREIPQQGPWDVHEGGTFHSQ